MLIDSAALFAQRQLGSTPTTLPRQESSAPVLPALPAVSDLLPWGGLRRGTAVEVATSPAATSLLLALLAGASRAGSWCAVVGVPDLGLLAAQEAGIQLSRLALVPAPGPEWAKVAAALVDGCDVVVVSPPASPAAEGRRLGARVRHRGAVLVSVGSWPGAEVRLTATAPAWEGAGDDGHGHLSVRRVAVRVEGRGAAARPRETTWWLPGPHGTAETSAETSTQTPATTPQRQAV